MGEEGNTKMSLMTPESIFSDLHVCSECVRQTESHSHGANLPFISITGTGSDFPIVSLKGVVACAGLASVVSS